MKVKILRDTPYRVSSAITQQFKAGSTVNVPRKTALDLIARGDAAAVKKPSTKGD
jgi:hypothetical protein